MVMNSSVTFFDDCIPEDASSVVVLTIGIGQYANLARQMDRLLQLRTQGAYVCVVTEAPLPTYPSSMVRRRELPSFVVPEGLMALRHGLLAGESSRFDHLAFVGELAQVTPEMLQEAQCVISGLGDAEAPVPEMMGCTLVTSVFQSDEFLQGFINNTVQLDGYESGLIDQVFVVANMTDHERILLHDLLVSRTNVILFWNRKDPGLYNCWNLGIRVARRRYVSNANVDDLRDPAHVTTLLICLEMHPEVHVAATALNPFYKFPVDGVLPDDRPGWYADLSGHFGLFDLAHLSTKEDGLYGLDPHNIPHCMPVWRRSIHDRYGWFNEARYGTFADWAFWMKSMRNGESGYLIPDALSFYFVNPNSHNRRGNELEKFHGEVEKDFVDMFLAQSQGRSPYERRQIPDVPRKLALTGHEQAFGEHRNSFNKLIHALEPLDNGTGDGVLFVPFLERYFVWGDAPGEAGSLDPRPITRDWVGVLHVPFDAPRWFGPEVSPERFFATDLWQESLQHCRGIITLAKDLENDVRFYAPGVPTLSVRHPVAFDARLFDPALYHARPRVVQVGDWLRKLQAIHRLQAPGHERVMLLKNDTLSYLGREIEQFGDMRDPAVDMRRMVSNDEYDSLLSSSVVLCLLYATAANNVVIECIARATPILINPLPAVIEYLGMDYPLYVRDEVEAGYLLSQPDRIIATHEYLQRRRREIDLSYSGFCRDIAESEWYSRL